MQNTQTQIPKNLKPKPRPNTLSFLGAYVCHEEPSKTEVILMCSVLKRWNGNGTHSHTTTLKPLASLNVTSTLYTNLSYNMDNRRHCLPNSHRHCSSPNRPVQTARQKR